jgi:nitrogen regulatory protein P-II 2
MQLITAIIKPHKLDSVKDALSDFGVSGITITEVRGFGKQKGHTELYRGNEISVDFLAKIKVEIATEKNTVDEIIKVIIDSAKTGEGEFGDGKIFVSTLDEVVRIRTDESGTAAI